MCVQNQTMKVLRTIDRWMGIALEPIRRNAVFFVFMYVLGVACAWIEIHRWEKPYGNLWLELFADLYLVCALIALLPRRAGKWLRRLLTVIFYALALIDVYCFVKFGSVLNPTMLLLVGETNAREAGEFVSSLLSADVLLSKLGWILLIMLVHMVVGVLWRRIARYRKAAQTENEWGQRLSLPPVALRLVRCCWRGR